MELDLYLHSDNVKEHLRLLVHVRALVQKANE